MSDGFRKVKDQIMPIKGRLRDKNVSAAVGGLKDALAAFLRSKLTRGEQLELRTVLDKAVYNLNFSKEFRNICPEGLNYEQGRENALLARLEEVESQAEDIRREQADRGTAKKRELSDSVLAKGKDLLDAGEEKKAAVLFRKTAKAHPGETALLRAMGMELARARLFAEAAEMLEAAMDEDSEDVGLLNQLAGCLRNLKQYDRAGVFFAKAISLSPQDEVLRFNSARNAMDSRNWTEAHDSLKKALEIRPDFSHARKALALVEKKIFLT